MNVQATGTIKHISGMCLDRADVKMGGSVLVNPCSGADSQKWEFEHYLTPKVQPSSALPARR